MYRSRTKLGNKARTIGVLVDYLGGPYQSAVLSGIADTAERLGTNVLCFAVGAVAGRRDAVVGGKDPGCGPAEWRVNLGLTHGSCSLA